MVVLHVMIHSIRGQNFTKIYHFLSPDKRTYVCVSEIRNISFSENFTRLQSGWSLSGNIDLCEIFNNWEGEVWLYWKLTCVPPQIFNSFYVNVLLHYSALQICEILESIEINVVTDSQRFTVKKIYILKNFAKLTGKHPTPFT